MGASIEGADSGQAASGPVSSKAVRQVSASIVVSWPHAGTRNFQPRKRSASSTTTKAGACCLLLG